MKVKIVYLLPIVAMYIITFHPRVYIFSFLRKQKIKYQVVKSSLGGTRAQEQCISVSIASECKKNSNKFESVSDCKYVSSPPISLLATQTAFTD